MLVDLALGHLDSLSCNQKNEFLKIVILNYQMSTYNNNTFYKVTKITPYHKISNRDSKIFDKAYSQALHNSNFPTIRIGACISSIKGTNDWL